MIPPDEPLDDIAQRLNHALKDLRDFSETLGDGLDADLRLEARRLVVDITVSLSELLDQLGKL